MEIKRYTDTITVKDDTIYQLVETTDGYALLDCETDRLIPLILPSNRVERCDL